MKGFEFARVCDEFSFFFLSCFLEFRDRCMKVIRCACTEKHFKLVINIVEEWMENRCLKDPSSGRFFLFPI